MRLSGPRLPVSARTNPVKVRAGGTRIGPKRRWAADRPARRRARAAQGADAADHGPPVELAGYLEELVARARRSLGDDLVGAYLAGSGALGGYIDGRSDVDVALVVRKPLDRAMKDELVASLRHEAFPCPARGLELVVYAHGSGVPELNLNTGERMEFLATFAPGTDSPHWFVLDRAIIGQRGLVLAGPPAADSLAQPSEDEILEALAIGLRWYRDRPNEPRDDAALNAVRSRAYLETGRWASRAEAVEQLLDEVTSSVENRRARSRDRGR